MNFPTKARTLTENKTEIVEEKIHLLPLRIVPPYVGGLRERTKIVIH